MAQLSARAIRVLAVLEDYRGGGSGDVLDALLPFFEPTVAEFAGKIFDPEECAARIRDEHRWNITKDVIEELIPRFAGKGWLQLVTRGDAAVYKGTYSGPATLSAPTEARVIETLANLVSRFKAFISELSPLSAVNVTDAALGEGLVEWLISEDAYSVDALREQVAITLDAGHGGGVPAATAPKSPALSSEMRYLCARFIKHLFTEKSDLIPDLCKLASVGLLTEVIRDFNAPTTKVNKTDLVVYLDAPVALDLMGVSGTDAAKNIRMLISQLQGIGASVRIFRSSVEELSNALDAVLRRAAVSRFGATADALRRNETSEIFVKQVANSPEPMLKEHGVVVDERKLEQFPNSHHHFSREQYEAFFNQVNWHAEIRPREHDAASITQIMRLRTGARTGDLFATRFVMVTRNGLLAQSSRRYCIRTDHISVKQVGPAIHQRQLATAVWLRTGLQMANDEIPRQYLLAACERVLELRPSVVTQVRLFARSLTPEKEQQLDLLLTQDRSTQVLMDKTLGASGVIGPQNIEILVDQMKEAFTAEIEEAKAKEVARVESVASSKVMSARKARTDAEDRAQRAEQQMAVAHEEDVQVVEQLLTEVNGFVWHVRNALVFGAGLILLLLGFGPIVAELLHGWQKFIPLVVVALVTVALARLQLLDRPTGLTKLLERVGKWRLQTLAAGRGLTEKVVRVGIGVNSNAQFEVMPQSLTHLPSGPADLLTPLSRENTRL